MQGPEHAGLYVNTWPRREVPPVKVTGKKAASQTSRKQQLFTGSQTFQIIAWIQDHFKENWSGNGQGMNLNTFEIPEIQKQSLLDICIKVDHEQLFHYWKLLKAFCGKED